MFGRRVGGDALRRGLKSRVGQLAPRGVTADELRRRVAAGRLHREFRGVYAVGHPGRSPDAWRMAAVLACGHRAVRCNASLAHHLGLLRGDGGSPVHVAAAGRRRAGQPGIRLHLPRALTRGEVTGVRGVPCTTVERLIADMAADASDADLATVIHRAQVRRLIRPGPMERQLARATKGIGRARALIEPAGPDLREAFEKRFHAFVPCGRWLAYEPNVLVATPLGWPASTRSGGARASPSSSTRGATTAIATLRDRPGARGRRRPRRHRPPAHHAADADRDAAVVEALLDHRVPARPI